MRDHLGADLKHADQVRPHDLMEVLGRVLLEASDTAEQADTVYEKIDASSLSPRTSFSAVAT